MTGVVIPGREGGYWRSEEAHEKEDFLKYEFYQCLGEVACFGTRPLDVGERYTSQYPNNSQCSFYEYYDANDDLITCNNQDDDFDSLINCSSPVMINFEHIDGSPLCSLCKEGSYSYAYECLVCPSGSVLTSVITVSSIVGFLFLLAVFVFLGWIPRLRILRCLQYRQENKDARKMNTAGRGGSRGANQGTTASSGGGGGAGLLDGAKVKVFLSFLQISSVYNLVYDVQVCGLCKRGIVHS